eukprot:scaffold584_cov132-Cylindrotheca_fusiformis.AAC.2
MERVQSLLLRGNRAKAVEEAIACKDYATALLVASMCDPETYKRTAKAYAENVFLGGSPMHTIGMLFSGAIQVPPDATPGNFWGIDAAELKVTWKKHLAAIISNRIGGWDRVTLSLGDRLREVDDIQAAHFCYMVCGCPVADPMREETRMALIGSDHRIESNITLHRNAAIDAFDRTEAYEWAKRRGNKNASIRSLQPFKLMFATLLTDYGMEDQARLYTLGIRYSSDITAVAAKSFSGSSWLQIFEKKEAFLGGFAALETRLDLDDGHTEPNVAAHESRLDQDRQSECQTTTTTKVTASVSGEMVGTINHSFGEEHHDVVNSTLNETEIDDTFVTAASNLMDNPGYSVSPERPRVPVSKPEFQSSTVETSKGVSREFYTSIEETSKRVPPEFHTSAVDATKRATSEFLSSTVDTSKRAPPQAFNQFPPRKDNEKMDKAHRESPPPPVDSLKPPPQVAPAPSMLSQNRPPSVQTSAPKQKVSPVAATPKETRRQVEKAPSTAPSIMVGAKKEAKSEKKQAPSSAGKNSRGLFSRIRTGLIKRFNPDATECTLPDNEEKPYYDKDLKVWVFPGEDPADVAKPIAPPPTIISKAPEAAPATEPSKDAAAANDPLAAMMAPPTRQPAALRRPGGPSASKPTTGAAGYPGMMMPPMMGKSPATGGGAAPPQFAVFTPTAKKEEKKAD